MRWLRKRPSKVGESIAPRTVRNVFDVVRRSLQAAVDCDLIPYNPADAATRELPAIEDKNPGERAQWLFTREEVELLISHAGVPADRHA